MHQVLDLLFDLGISGAMCGLDETVIGVFSRVQRSHAGVDFAEEDGGQEMIYRERVVRVPLQHLIELLNGRVVIEIVEMIEGGVVQRVAGPNRQIGSEIGALVRLRSGRGARNAR